MALVYLLVTEKEANKNNYSLCQRWVLFNVGLASQTTSDYEIDGSLVEVGRRKPACISKSIILKVET
jgi:hypothetical protein